ncbi:hypothetical protein GOP47_0016420 [Adiantum capillus-veneris]|uniref:Uncharacterized protein n=1 Tax=Adiantum capillus-veneris TaxID=13818 RepID=A0A9D4UHM9_ADICA|nr:hypothetical protein GOP47_0016420 [Adiantum capillus-veneris]
MGFATINVGFFEKAGRRRHSVGSESCFVVVPGHCEVPENVLIERVVGRRLDVVTEIFITSSTHLQKGTKLRPGLLLELMIPHRKQRYAFRAML